MVSISELVIYSFLIFFCNPILNENGNIQYITKWDNKKEQLPWKI